MNEEISPHARTARNIVICGKELKFGGRKSSCKEYCGTHRIKGRGGGFF